MYTLPPVNFNLVRFTASLERGTSLAEYLLSQENGNGRDLQCFHKLCFGQTACEDVCVSCHFSLTTVAFGESDCCKVRGKPNVFLKKHEKATADFETPRACHAGAFSSARVLAVG